MKLKCLYISIINLKYLFYDLKKKGNLSFNKFPFIK